MARGGLQKEVLSQVRPEEPGVRQVKEKEAQAEAVAVSKSWKKKQDIWETKYLMKAGAQSVKLRSGE